jgi:hypothetical protein
MRSLSAVDALGAGLIGVLSAVVLMLAAAIGVFVAAVWLGMHVIAPRLRRALDRAETEDEHDGDRDD